MMMLGSSCGEAERDAPMAMDLSPNLDEPWGEKEKGRRKKKGKSPPSQVR